MMFVVDTNVILYAVNKSSPLHATCRKRLHEWRRRSEPWFLTWGIIREFLRIATDPRVFSRPLREVDVWPFLQSLVLCRSVTVLSEGKRHREIVAEILEEVPEVYGHVRHDVHTAAIMREHDIHVICTRDARFHRFPFLEVRDPLH